jgi:hypothetical protein
MPGVSSRLRARAASPSAAAANVAAEAPSEKNPLHSPADCDAFYGFPFRAGYLVGRFWGIPCVIVGFIFYLITALPRNILNLVNVLFVRMSHAMLQVALLSAALSFIFIMVALKLRVDLSMSNFASNLLRDYAPEVYWAGGFNYAAVLSVASIVAILTFFFVVKFRALNIFFVGLLAKWLLPNLSQRIFDLFDIHRILNFFVTNVTSAAQALDQTASAPAAQYAAAVALLMLSMIVARYLASAAGTLQYRCLWLLLFIPRFIVGCARGVSGSFEYALCAITLSYHPNHAW